MTPTPTPESDKIWAIDEIFGYTMNHNECNAVSSLTPKLYQNDAKSFCWQQNFSFNDFIFLSSKCEDVFLDDVTLLNDDNSVVPLEMVIEVLRNAKSFHYVFDFGTAMEVVTIDTVNELVKIPHFKELNRFVLEGIPESFDIQTFYEYIKGNKKTKICLGFDDEYSDDYLVLLQTIVYEIRSTENRDYKFPYINIDSMED
uniref:Uncharacterized protein n=1 Tax=Panagrolaimus davidi TaxID=227884 RepID=A0A914PBM5_9BILA